MVQRKTDRQEDPQKDNPVRRAKHGWGGPARASDSALPATLEATPTAQREARGLEAFVSLKLIMPSSVSRQVYLFVFNWLENWRSWETSSE